MTNAATNTHTQALPTGKDDLLAYLDNLGIEYRLYEHEPIFTVEQGEPLKKTILGMHCRNLFLRDKKKNMFLITAANETRLDLKKLSDLLPSARLSFASPVRLYENLGIMPGAVNPFCIMNDKKGTIRMILDSTMMDVEIVNYHPMDNAWTIGMSPDDLLAFLDSTGHDYEVLDLTQAHPDAN
ncbi:MAG: prolyl-tRNA synthetase associated domain-containing protein [Alphaproteobacteria bacterium]